MCKGKASQTTASALLIETLPRKCVWFTRPPKYVYSFLSETLHARRVSGLLIQTAKLVWFANYNRTHTTVSSFRLGLSLLLVDLGIDMEGMPSEMLVGLPLSMLLALTVFTTGASLLGRP